MLLTTFNQEVYEKGVRAEGFEEGYESGYESGYEEGALSGAIKTYIESCQEFAVIKENTLLRLMEKFSLERAAAEEYLEKYWKS